jgi:uncharacterized damage-inducible protein DinB
VPEAKVGKNRLHLDLRPGTPRDVEVQRLVGLGATITADRRTADGAGWVVLVDPEGNELCVEQSGAERGEPDPVSTGDRPLPPIHTAAEAPLLLGMLEWYRRGVVAKASGASEAHAGASPFRSATSIAGVVLHLALVEDIWLHVRFAGHHMPEPWASAPWDEDPDWEFTTGAARPLGEALALYEAACGRSRTAVAGRSPEDLAARVEPRSFSLRFALVHLIEETARHLGHLDVLREALDGTTGE